jgi:hypothetical protein
MIEESEKKTYNSERRRMKNRRRINRKSWDPGAAR